MSFALRLPGLLATTVLTLGPSVVAAPSPLGAEGARFGDWSVLAPLETGAAEDEARLFEAIGAGSGRLALDGPGIDLARSVPGKGGPSVTWQAIAGDDQDAIDLAAIAGAERSEEALAYLIRRIEVDVEERPTVWFGSDDGLRVWLDGTLLHQVDVPRMRVAGEDRLVLRLAPGVHHLLCEVRNLTGGWSFQMIRDERRLDRERTALEAEVNRAIDRGVDWLLRHQEIDGSWAHEASQFRNGQTSLALYTLLKSGLSKDHPSIRRGMTFLRASPPERTYSGGFQMMLLEALGGRDEVRDMMLVLERLLEWQDRGFGYPLRTIDLSNTQVGALGLAAAGRKGLGVDLDEWEEVADFTLSCHNDNGGFAYQPGEVSTGSMTAAGIATAKLCRDALSARERKYKKLVQELDAAMAAGTEWLSSRFRTDENPSPKQGPGTRWKYYYLYGVERAGAFLGATHFGAHDWYLAGARRLVSEQKPEGAWASGNGEDQPNTCFALLFLQRASVVRTGENMRSSFAAWGDDDPSSDVSLRASGDPTLTVWISSFGRQVLEQHATSPQVASVEYFVDGTPAAEVVGGSLSAGAGERWPVRLPFKAGGEHRIHARVTLAGGTVLESVPLVVTLSGVLEEWMVEYGEDLARNRLMGVRVKASASSASKDHGAALAVDGRQGSSWLCAPDDAVRSLTLEFDSGLRAQTLLLSPGFDPSKSDDSPARPSVVEVRWNGRPTPIRIRMDPSSPLKTVHEFEKPILLRSLELRIVEVRPAASGDRSCGLAEVELQEKR